MRFLLTNDDGIYARGLSALYRELSKDADCLVVAPEVEQSAVGHAITISRPLMVRPARKNGQFMGWAVAGTPADCVKIGLRELSDKPVDLVVSGINLGANVGINVLYSGTVSAATEGAILGVPSIAVSLGTHSRDADRFMLEHNPNRHIPLNVNVPALPEKDIRGVVVTRQGQARLMEQFEKRIDPRENVYYWLAGETQVTDAEDDGTDFLALRNGMISITPIYYDLTRHDALEGLRAAIDKLAP